MVAYLEPKLLREVAAALADEQLDHPMLVAGLHRGLQLQRRADFGSVWQDLNTLNRTGRLDDGSLPLQLYLETGLFVLERSGRARGEGAQAFTRALGKLSAALTTRTDGPAFAWTAPRITTPERITAGASSLLGIAWLEVGLERAEAVARVSVAARETALGTAFLVAPSILLTNHHVAFPGGGQDPQPVVVWFRYQDPRPAAAEVPVERLEGVARAGEADAANDWALVRLAQPVSAPVVRLQAPGLPLEVDDRVCIIQHPEGGPKKISVHKNLVRSVDRTGGRVQYLTDTLPGSSGSPVFNDRWELVALHHAATVAPGADGALENRNEGITVDAIIRDIRARGDAALCRDLGI